MTANVIIPVIILSLIAHKKVVDSDPENHPVKKKIYDTLSYILLTIIPYSITITVLVVIIFTICGTLVYQNVI